MKIGNTNTVLDKNHNGNVLSRVLPSWRKYLYRNFTSEFINKGYYSSDQRTSMVKVWIIFGLTKWQIKRICVVFDCGDRESAKR